MGAHRSATRRIAGLAAAVSALALLAACETGPTPEEIHMMDWQQAARPAMRRVAERCAPMGKVLPSLVLIAAFMNGSGMGRLMWSNPFRDGPGAQDFPAMSGHAKLPDQPLGGPW